MYRDRTLLRLSCAQTGSVNNVYTVDKYASVHKTSLLCKCTKRLARDRQTDFNIKNERNVQGWNITKECTETEHY